MPEIGDDRPRRTRSAPSFDKQGSKPAMGVHQHQTAYSVSFERGRAGPRRPWPCWNELSGTTPRPSCHSVCGTRSSAAKQAEAVTYDGIKSGRSVQAQGHGNRGQPPVGALGRQKSDLIGKLAEGTQLTRPHDCRNPEGHERRDLRAGSRPTQLHRRAIRLINEQRQRCIIEHLAYDPVEDKFTTSTSSQRV